MNFLITTFHFPPEIGGVQTRAKQYVQNLVKLGHKVTIIVLTSSVNKVYSENYFGASLFRCPFTLKFVFPIFSMVLRTVKDHPIDALYILSGGNTFIGLLFLLYGKIKKIRTGISLFGREDIATQRDSLSHFYLFQFALLLTSKIGVNSKATSRLLPKKIMHKIHILYPGADLRSLELREPPRMISNKEKKVLFVGRLVKRKGVDDLLHAFKLMLKKVPRVKLVIVGDGPQKTELQDLSKQLGIQDKIHFTGILVGRELYNEYRECDVFVAPSKEVSGDPAIEGFGIVFLEAGLFKKPSIGTWHWGIPEAILHEETGILVPEGDIKALANALESLLTNRDLAEKLGQNAYKRVIKNFTWEKATLRLIKMFS